MSKSGDKKAKSGKIDPKSPFAALRGVKEKLAKEEEARAASGKKPPPQERRPDGATRVAPRSAQAEEEERMSFHRLMSGVTPLEQTKGLVPRSAQVPPATELAKRPRAADVISAAQSEAEEVHAHLRALVEGKERFEVEDDGHRVEGRRVDLPQEMLRKLRRGLVPIDARLDLHGLGASEARAAIEKTLREKRVGGERCVLVVHGKGEHSPRGHAVLRGEIAAWLSQGPASEHVAAFATAAQDDGGEGAVYVLLRR